MNYETSIPALRQQMLRGAEIIKRDNQRTQGFRTDGYMNMLNKYGTSRDSSSHYIFRPDAMAMDTQLTEVYEGNGLFTKIIDLPAEEALKRGFDLGIKDQGILDYLYDKLDALEWEQNASQALKWTRLYGGALVVMLINDGGSLTDPVNWNNVRSIDELRVYERPLVYPEYNSIYSDIPNEPGRVSCVRFGSPQYYTVSSIYGSFRVHESRCLHFRNGVLPENSLNTQYRFWGTPEYDRIKRSLQETYTSHGNGVKMLDRCVQAVYKMRGLGNKLLTDDGENDVLKRLNAIDTARGILNTMIIDADGEDYDYKQMSMSGVREIIDSTCNMLSAVTNIPQTILFGRSPAGMNSTGENDMENYYNMVERIQKLNLKANGRTLLQLIFKEGVVTGNLSEIPKFKMNFQKLWSLSEKEQADLDKVKADTEYVKAQTAQIYVDMQVLNPEEVRAGLAKDDTFLVEDLLSDEDLDLTGTEVAETAIGSQSIDDILMAIENGTEDTTGMVPVDTMETDSEPYRNIHTVEDIVESIEDGTEDAAAVLVNNTDIDEILVEKEGQRGIITPTFLKDKAREFGYLQNDEQPKDLNVGVGVLIVKDGKVLVAERSDGKGWCGPGGHMQEGEDTIEAALREAYEEFGILPKYLYPMEGFVVPLGYNEEINQFYCTDYEGEVKADDNEMYNAKFVSLEELQKLPLFPPFAQALEKFLQLVTGNDSISLTLEAKTDTINVSTSNEDSEDWITLKNGAHIPIDNNGNLKGKVGEKIANESEKKGISYMKNGKINESNLQQLKGKRKKVGKPTEELSGKYKEVRIACKNVSKKEAEKVIHEINNLYSSKYSNDKSGVIYTHGNKANSKAKAYYFDIDEFDVVTITKKK